MREISTHKEIPNTGIILLAAGGSERMGKPKPLLQYKGHTLLQHAISEALQSSARPVIVVLGANENLVSKEINPENIQVIVNAEWKAGIASSIQAGLNGLLEMSRSVDSVILILCDQPHVSSSLLNELITTAATTGKLIVASDYGSAIGPPVLFHRDFFPELMQLKGDAGAKKIIQKHVDQLALILFREGSVDIDTQQDYEALISGGDI